jgi:hypothetical protein
MISFAARFNEQQKAKLLEVANKQNISEAEMLRKMVDEYGTN